MTPNDVSLHRPFDWRRLAQSVDHIELLLLAIAAPFLLFSNPRTPLAFALILFIWLVRWLDLGRLTYRTPLDVPELGLLVMAFVGYAILADSTLSQAKLWGIILGVAVYCALLNNLRDQRSIMRFAPFGPHCPVRRRFRVASNPQH